MFSGTFHHSATYESLTGIPYAQDEPSDTNLSYLSSSPSGLRKSLDTTPQRVAADLNARLVTVAPHERHLSMAGAIETVSECDDDESAIELPRTIARNDERSTTGLALL